MAMTVISPTEVAIILKKSLSWVYAHASELGASRIGGSLIYTMEGIVHAFEEGKGLVNQGHESIDQRRVHPRKHLKRLGTRAEETLEERGRRHNLTVFNR